MDDRASEKPRSGMTGRARCRKQRALGLSSEHALGLRTRGVSTGTEGTKVNCLRYINIMSEQGSEVQVNVQG